MARHTRRTVGPCRRTISEKACLSVTGRKCPGSGRRENPSEEPVWPLHALGFEVEEEPLAGQTTSVAGELPARTDDAMARDKEAHGVPTDRSAYFLRSGAVSQLASQVSV